MQDRPIAIVTGASAGIGLAVSKRLSVAGHRVVMVGRRADRLEEAASTVGENAHPVPADVSAPGEARRLVRETIERFGRLDVLVNNAGTAPLMPVERHDDTALEMTYRTNALAPASAIAEAWAALKESKGCIVSVSTMATHDPFPGFFGYAASKAAVNLMTLSCHKEGAEYGIRVFCVAPGAVETEMLRAIAPESVVPKAVCLQPDQVASVITECVAGSRDEQRGKIIWVDAQHSGGTIDPPAPPPPSPSPGSGSEG